MAVRIIIPEGFVKVTRWNAEAAWSYLERGVSVVRVKGGKRMGTYVPMFCLPYMFAVAPDRARSLFDYSPGSMNEGHRTRWKAKGLKALADPMCPPEAKEHLHLQGLRMLTAVAGDYTDSWEDVPVSQLEWSDLIDYTKQLVRMIRLAREAAGVDPQAALGLDDECSP